MEELFETPIDKLLDENNTENIVLYNEDNEPVEFEQIALMPCEGKVYAILKPVGEGMGLAEDEALVFYIDVIDDEECLMLAEDDRIIDLVFAEYYRLLQEAEE